MNDYRQPLQPDVMSSETYEELLVLTARERVAGTTTAIYRVEVPAGMPLPTVLKCGVFRLTISSQETK